MNRILLFKGDITKVTADAIVNAANSSLLGGGGVDGAIHRAGGPAVLDECRDIRNRQGKCKTGEAVITTAGSLPARYVIHTVGPVWNGGYKNEPEFLANCYTNSLKLAVANNVTTITFPNISTGIYGYPKAGAARVAVAAVKEFLAQDSTILTVTFVCFDEDNYNLYKTLLEV
jgi:O-acetyl-ADP-ribose deacetylase (regulator of RNase III)